MITELLRIADQYVVQLNIIERVASVMYEFDLVQKLKTDLVAASGCKCLIASKQVTF